MADPTKVSSGPGWLYIAPLGTALPAGADFDFEAAAAWTPLGYTEDGHTFGYGVETEDFTPAETLDPIAVLQTGRNITVSFNLWETTFRNLQIALNGGFISATGDYFRPPEIGDVTTSMIGWRSAEMNPVARVGEEMRKQVRVWRNCLSTGDVSIQQNKGTVSTLAVEMRCLVPPDDDATHGRVPFVFFDQVAAAGGGGGGGGGGE